MRRNSARIKNTHVAKLHTALLALHKMKVEKGMMRRCCRKDLNEVTNVHQQSQRQVYIFQMKLSAHSSAQARDSAAMIVLPDHRADVSKDLTSMDLTSIRFPREQSNIFIRLYLTEMRFPTTANVGKTLAASASPTVLWGMV